MKTEKIAYGVVRNAKELGSLTRAHRKSRAISLETVGGLGNLGKRFLSEFERGKETAELGKVLKALHTLGLEVIVQPRRPAPKGSIAVKVSPDNLADREHVLGAESEHHDKG